MKNGKICYYYDVFYHINGVIARVTVIAKDAWDARNRFKSKYGKWKITETKKMDKV